MLDGNIKTHVAWNMLFLHPFLLKYYKIIHACDIRLDLHINFSRVSARLHTKQMLSLWTFTALNGLNDADFTVLHIIVQVRHIKSDASKQ